MRKLLLFMFAFALMGCVDKDFDLGDVDDSDIVFGDEFVAPIGKLELVYSDLFDFSQAVVKSVPMVSIPDEFEAVVAIGSGFDQGIVDLLPNSGTQFITTKITSNLPSTMLYVKLFFEGLEEPVIEGKINPTPTTLQKEVSKETLSAMTRSKKIIIKFSVVGGASVVPLDPEETLTALLNLYRKGGIKFN